MPLSNSQYQTIMRVYEEKQNQSRHQADLRFEKACEEIPELATIDSQIAHCGVCQAVKLLDGDESALLQLKEEIRQLSHQRETLLINAGFPADYLEPVHECPDCQDTGYIGSEKCHCFKKAIIDLFYTQSHLKGTLEKENFDHFSFSYYSQNYLDRLSGQTSLELAKKAYQECRDFSDHFDSQGGNLLLFGTTGAGKTFLTHCIAKEIMDSIHSVLYLTSTELFDTFLANVLNKTEESQLLYEQIQECDLLIIDDLGTERNTDFVVSQLFVCLNNRILNEKSTIISTNLALEDIKTNYTERVFSRISNQYRILRLAGDDIRIQKKLMCREDHH